MKIQEKFLHTPRVTIVVDTPDWAFDISIQQVIKYLEHYFDITVKYVVDSPHLDEKNFDLLHICFWGEQIYKKFSIPAHKIVKEVSSHRWQFDDRYGTLTPEQFVEGYFQDAQFAVATSVRLMETLSPFLPYLWHIENGVDTKVFFCSAAVPSGDMRIAWVGNATDPVKGVHDILLPAANTYNLTLADGFLPHGDLPQLYRSADVIAICSAHEGEPLPLIEAMACGCFPVCCDVGIVPELVRHKQNGFIVSERTTEAFAAAFAWCKEHLHGIRSKRDSIAEEVAAKRDWAQCAGSYKAAWEKALRESYFPIFRNDDVAADTHLEHFKRFCKIFHDNGFTQIHGVTLYGHCNTLYDYGGLPSEYVDETPLSFMRNSHIKKLSKKYPIKNNVALVKYLDDIPDELAFHGVYHSDFSQMTRAEQEETFRIGLEQMKVLFPKKQVRYFIPPFNRINDCTESSARRFGLSILATDGIHFESVIHTNSSFSKQVYRYHHHRFYPETRFKHYALNFSILENALSAPIDFNCKQKDGQIEKDDFQKKVVHHENIFSIPLSTIQTCIVGEAGANPWHYYAYTTLQNRSFTYDTLVWIRDNLPKNARILEAASGAGQNLFLLYSWGYTKLHGIELETSAHTAALLLQKKMQYQDVEFINDNIFTYSSDAQYDIIIAINCIYCIKNVTLEDFLCAWIEKVAPAGYIIFDVIDVAYNSISKNDLLTSDWDKPIEDARPSEYLCRYTKSDILSLANKFKLELRQHTFYALTPQRSVYILQK